MSKMPEMVNVRLRNIIQGIIQKGAAQEPCGTYWSYQPHRPEKPLVQPEKSEFTVYKLYINR